MLNMTVRLACCITFAAVIVAIAIEVQYFSASGGQSQKGIDGAVLFFILPLSLVIINSIGVRVSPRNRLYQKSTILIRVLHHSYTVFGNSSAAL